jgi:hypothetical protein
MSLYAKENEPSYFLPGANKQSFSPFLELGGSPEKNIFFQRGTSDWVKLSIFCQNFAKESSNFRQILPENIRKSTGRIPKARIFLTKKHGGGEWRSIKGKKFSSVSFILSEHARNCNLFANFEDGKRRGAPYRAYGGEGRYGERSWKEGGGKKEAAWGSPGNSGREGKNRHHFYPQ